MGEPGCISDATMSRVGPGERPHRGEQHRSERHYIDVVAGPLAEQDGAASGARLG